MEHVKETFETCDYWAISLKKAHSLRFQICSYTEKHTYECCPLPCSRFVYICTGKARFYQNEKVVFAGKEHEVLYIPRGTAYFSEWSSPSSYLVVDMWYMPVASHDEWFPSHFSKLFEDKGNVLGAFVQLVLDEYETANPLQQLEWSTAFTRFLCEVSHNRENVALIEAGIYHAVLYLRQCFASDISTDELAQMSSFSPSQFRRLFKKHMGMSPTEYRNQLRVQRAQELIKIQKLTAAQAAEKVGFTDVNYFYRLAKRQQATAE